MYIKKIRDKKFRILNHEFAKRILCFAVSVGMCDRQSTRSTRTNAQTARTCDDSEPHCHFENTSTGEFLWFTKTDTERFSCARYRDLEGGGKNERLLIFRPYNNADPSKRCQTRIADVYSSFSLFRNRSVLRVLFGSFSFRSILKTQTT